MAGVKWSSTELGKLRKLYSQKPPYETDYEWARKFAPILKRSSESIRWQLRDIEYSKGKVEGPKILLLDIETLPILAKVWAPWKQDVNPAQVVKDWSIVCWSAKWLFSDKVYGQVVKPQEAIDHTDKSVLAGIWELVNEADIVIAHNGDGFDMKRLNTRWLIAGFPPPMYYQSIDTLKVVKEKFDFTYNQMDWINSILGISRKMSTSFKWWDECDKGNKKYLNLMLEYNKKDVQILEELYLKIRPWIAKHPNMNLYAVGDVCRCPACSSSEIKWTGKYSTPLGIYQGFRCQVCGAIGRSTRKQYKIKGSVVNN